MGNPAVRIRETINPTSAPRTTNTPNLGARRMRTGVPRSSVLLTCLFSHPQDGEMLREVGARPGGGDPAVRERGSPLFGARRGCEPGCGLHLDDVGWRSPGMARSLDRLDCAERWHSNLDGVARRALG